MGLQEILNTDHRAVARWLRQALSWWLDALAELVPAPLRRGGGRSRERLLQASDDGYLLDGEAVRDAPRGGASVAFAFGPAEVLVRELDLPLIPLRDARRLTALDLDRLTPFRSDEVYTALEPRSRDEAAGRQILALAVVKRGVADAAVARCAADGWRVVSLGVAGDEDDPRFDFLPAMRAASGAADPARRKVQWWMAAAAAVLVNLGVFIGRDIASTDALRGRVQAQAAAAGVAMALRARAQGEQLARADLARRRNANEPLRLIAAAGEALPPPAWLERMEWNGRAVRLAGFAPAGFDVLAAVRGSPAFANPRALGLDPQTPAGALKPFDVVADPESHGS